MRDVLQMVWDRSISDARSLRIAIEVVERELDKWDRVYADLPAHHKPFYDEVFGSDIAQLKTGLRWLNRSYEMVAFDRDEVWREWLTYRIERRNKRKRARAAKHCRAMQNYRHRRAAKPVDR